MALTQVGGVWGEWVQDPETGSLVFQESAAPEMSPNQQKQSVLAALGRTAGKIVDPRTSMLPYLLPYGVALEAGMLGGTAGMTAAKVVSAANAAAGGAGTAGAAGAGAAGAGAAGAGAAGAGAAGAGAAGAGAAGAGAAGAGAAGAGAAGAGFGLPQAFEYGSRILGAAGNARDANRAAEADAAARAAELELARYQAGLQGVQTDLDQRRYLDEYYNTNARRALFGGLLAGASDLDIRSPSNIPRANISGGIRPSAIQGRADIGNLMQRNALIELIDPTQPGSGPAGGQDVFMDRVRQAQDVIRQNQEGLDFADPNAVDNLVAKMNAAGIKATKNDFDRVSLADYPEMGWNDVLQNKAAVEGRGPVRGWANQPFYDKDSFERLRAQGRNPHTGEYVGPAAMLIPRNAGSRRLPMLPTMPAMPTYSQPGALDKGLDIGSIGLGALSLFAPELSRRRRNTAAQKFGSSSSASVSPYTNLLESGEVVG